MRYYETREVGMLEKSSNPLKKFMVVSPSGRLVHFGAAGYSDFTLHKNLRRKESYQSRHFNDYINDPEKPGFYAWWLLWNKPTLQESIDDTNRTFNLNIRLKTPVYSSDEESTE
jgi:hypothetical protein